MRISIDTDAQTLVVDSGSSSVTHPLYSPSAFGVIKDLWLKAGWELKYPYLFSWLGRPIIQLPEDLMTVQEVIFRVQPDVIIETGVAHGGSLVFYAGLCQLMGRGRVLGIDIEIRPHNRAAIEGHPLYPRISLIEGSSIDPTVVARAREFTSPEKSVLVILDSNHSRSHVLSELEAYAPLVSSGSYLVATDGIMELVCDVPRGVGAWETDNPKAAARDFLESHPEFILEDPPLPSFDESAGIRRATHWPGAYLRRR